MNIKANKIELNIKYIKLINHIDSQRTKWSHYDEEKVFYLGWIMNGNNENLNKGRKKNDAGKAKAAEKEQILLCQNHFEHGHRVTHVVQPMDDKVIEKQDFPENRDYIWWERKVKVVWMAEKPWEKAPLTKDVIGSRFSFRSGNLVSINAETIDLNLDFLK